ncbi:hypothetical protein POTOM_034872 [Populus tomentosa]|uniref:Dirigent protein n=1 Tax=Populus tomentosa TaxID=118781 RepID=A0A8X8CPX9_POPTO|nr:hypothetical protein POTOM_034872 [Populus tomentosa]
MARMAALVYALIICVAVAPSYGEYYSKGSHVPRKEKVARLHFFLHDIVSRKSPIVHVFAVDDPLRVGSEPNSKIVGKAQKLYSSSSQDASLMGVRSGSFQGLQYGRGVVRLRWLEEEGSSGWLRDLPRSAPAFSMLLRTGDAILEYNVTLVLE